MNLLTIEEVAKTLRVSSMTVYREIKRKRLHAIRVGHLYRIPEEALSEYVGKREAS